MKDWLVIGRFTAPYGIKGWLKVLSHTEPMENIGEYEPIWIAEGNGWKPIALKRVQSHGKGLVAQIAGCDDRTQAEQFIGRDIAIQRNQLPKLPQGEYYWSELEGLEVFTLQGQKLGSIDHLLETGANDVMVVKPSPGSVDDQERLIPYVPEIYVMAVQKDQGRMTVDWELDY